MARNSNKSVRPQGHDTLFQTRAIPKTVNPKWEETFDSYVDNPFRELVFQVTPKILQNFPTRMLKSLITGKGI